MVGELRLMQKKHAVTPPSAGCFGLGRLESEVLLPSLLSCMVISYVYVVTYTVCILLLIG